MAATGRIDWEELRVLDAASLTGGYDELGDPLEHPSYILKMVNTSDVEVTVSIDGLKDIDVCPANSYWLYDESKVGQSGWLPAIPKGTQILVKGTAGTGNIYLVSQFVCMN